MFFYKVERRGKRTKLAEVSHVGICDLAGV